MGLSAACSSQKPALTGLVEAHDAAAALQVHFTKAVEASNRAVMADTDEASISAAHEAEKATHAALEDVTRLRPLLGDLHLADELRALEAFDTRFTEYRRIDRDILPLAVENTNLKAQKLLFGGCTDAVAEIRAAVAALAQSQRGISADRKDALVAQTAAAVLEVQVVLARHIAEADEVAMTRMEERIHTLESVGEYRHQLTGPRDQTRSVGRRSIRTRPLQNHRRRNHAVVAAQHERPVARIGPRPPADDHVAVPRESASARHGTLGPHV